ncbi:MAG: hypothetical protein M9883_02600 [Methylobacteriaceae bacterium]|nr:hypothetical protein [Methylobacteriaceae bacterium]
MSQNEEKPLDGKGAVKKPIQAHLGDQLKRYFSSIVSEPVPDRFASLLDELEKRERSGAPQSPEARE